MIPTQNSNSKPEGNKVPLRKWRRWGRRATTEQVQEKQSSQEEFVQQNQIGYVQNDLQKRIKAILSNNSYLTKRRRYQYTKKGFWSDVQQAKYYLFLILNLDNFQSQKLRRSQKIFKEMSTFLGSRNASQCRSHHQKQEKKFNTVDSIILNLYHEVKDHPIILETTRQSPDKDEPIEALNNSQQAEKTQKSTQIKKEPQAQKRGEIIFQEMPQGLNPISQQMYINLFCKGSENPFPWQRQQK